MMQRVIAGALAGAAIAILFEFAVVKTGTNNLLITFVAWLQNPAFAGPIDVILFAIFGAIAGAGITYAAGRHN